MAKSRNFSLSGSYIKTIMSSCIIEYILDILKKVAIRILICEQVSPKIKTKILPFKSSVLEYHSSVLIRHMNKLSILTLTTHTHTNIHTH